MDPRPDRDPSYPHVPPTGYPPLDHQQSSYNSEPPPKKYTASRGSSTYMHECPASPAHGDGYSPSRFQTVPPPLYQSQPHLQPSNVNTPPNSLLPYPWSGSEGIPMPEPTTGPSTYPDQTFYSGPGQTQRDNMIQQPTQAIPSHQQLKDMIMSEIQKVNVNSAYVPPSAVEHIVQGVLHQLHISVPDSVPPPMPSGPPYASTATGHPSSQTPAGVPRHIPPGSGGYTQPAMSSDISRPADSSSSDSCLLNGLPPPDRTDRPRGPPLLIEANGTSVEIAWNTLFNAENEPTERLEQFLRGVAMHLDTIYRSSDSLVVTPDKMIRYYDDSHVSMDLWPWDVIFSSHSSRISRVYRSLCVEHHLIQNDPGKKPQIPGLTPTGFARWMALMIQAFPDQEFDRLRKIVQNMPISNPDTNERFPRDLSRRLFPLSPDHSLRQALQMTIEFECELELPAMSALPPVDAPETVLPEKKVSFADEDGYIPRSPTPGSDGGPDGSPGPIPERRRAPYSTHPRGSRDEAFNSRERSRESRHRPSRHNRERNHSYERTRESDLDRERRARNQEQYRSRDHRRHRSSLSRLRRPSDSDGPGAVSLSEPYHSSRRRHRSRDYERDYRDRSRDQVEGRERVHRRGRRSSLLMRLRNGVMATDRDRNLERDREKERDTWSGDDEYYSAGTGTGTGLLGGQGGRGF